MLLHYIAHESLRLLHQLGQLGVSAQRSHANAEARLVGDITELGKRTATALPHFSRCRQHSRSSCLCSASGQPTAIIRREAQLLCQKHLYRELQV